MPQISATRAAAEARVTAFTPRMGPRYAKRRNIDRGPGAHADVSVLSPYLRRRMVTERGVVAAALGGHGPEGAEKFVQEVVWRGYFKGWLERRPAIWAEYRDGLARDLATLDTDRRLRRDVARAEAGQTGLDCFDAWARELVETGYLHNHARMWFASIWIFTLGLPWRVGADFFYRHLLDGDPASNTLGWRWVAGLHTRGKAYAAQAWNIAKCTEGRFAPRDADLAADVTPLDYLEPEGLPTPTPLRRPATPQPGQPTLLLVTEEDLRPDDFDMAALDIVGTVTLAASHLRSPRAVADHVAEFERGALADAAAQLGGAVALDAGMPADLARHAARLGATQIVTPYLPEGPLRDWLRPAADAARAQGIALCEWQRDWDRLIWPHATAGFFKVKKAIPRLLHETGLD